MISKLSNSGSGEIYIVPQPRNNIIPPAYGQNDPEYVGPDRRVPRQRNTPYTWSFGTNDARTARLFDNLAQIDEERARALWDTAPVPQPPRRRNRRTPPTPINFIQEAEDAIRDWRNAQIEEVITAWPTETTLRSSPAREFVRGPEN